MRSLQTLAIYLLLVAPALAVENLPKEVVGHLNRQGPVVSTKFFRSWYPFAQIAVYYCVDENLKGGKNEGASGAANTHCSIALFNRSSPNQWRFGGESDLGQGDIKDFSNGFVTAETVFYADDDPLSTPSKRIEIRFSTAKGTLVQVNH